MQLGLFFWSTACATIPSFNFSFTPMNIQFSNTIICFVFEVVSCYLGRLQTQRAVEDDLELLMFPPSFLFLLFETGFLCVALTVLEHTM